MGAVAPPLILILMSVAAHGQSAVRSEAGSTPLTLSAALGDVLAHHPLVLAAENEIQVARGLGLQAAQPPAPSLSYSYSRVTSDAAVSELLEFPGKRALRAQAAALSVRQAEQNLRAARAAIAFQTRRAFYSRLLADQDLATAQQTLAAVQSIRNDARARFQAGDAARLDVVKADLELARAQQQVRIARGAQRVATLTLNVLLGRSPEQTLAVSGDLAAAPAVPGFKTLLKEAYEQNPALKRARLERDKQQRDVELAKRQKFPDLDLSASYGTEDGVRTPGLVASINIPLPGRYRGQLEQAAGQSLAAVAGVQAAYYQVTEAVAAAYQQWLAARAQVKTFQSSLLAESATVLSGAEASYRAGETGILGVLEAERTNLQVRQAYAHALFDLQIAAASTILARGGVQ